MSQTNGTGQETLYTLGSGVAVTKNTYTTIAAYTGVLGTNTVCKIPGGWLFNEGVNPLGRMCRLTVAGSIATTAAATFANAINLNPTAGTSTGNVGINTAYTPTASVTAQWWLTALLTCTAFATSTATWQVNGTVEYMTVAAAGAVSTAENRQGFAGSWVGLDPRVDQYLELFGTWSASAAGNTTTVQQMLLEGLN